MVYIYLDIIAVITVIDHKKVATLVANHLGDVLVSTGALKMVKLSVCNALNGKLKYKR